MPRHVVVEVLHLFVCLAGDAKAIQSLQPCRFDRQRVGRDGQQYELLECFPLSADAGRTSGGERRFRFDNRTVSRSLADERNDKRGGHHSDGCGFG